MKRNVPLAQASSEEAVLSTRVQEALGQRSTTKSAVSRTFVERTRRSLGELMSRRLDDVRLAVTTIDGLELQGRTNVVALGITTEGVKIPLGLWEGSTENATVATAATPARPARCAKAWKRRSPSLGSASPAR